MHSNAPDSKISATIFVFSLILSVCVDSRMFHSLQMCNSNKQINDCSFQFPSADTNSCLIYSTDACRSNGFLPWSLEPLSKASSESDSQFSVTILPYAVHVHEIHRNSPVSAVNITLTSLNEDISGFSMLVTEDIRSRNACRIFDFRKSLDKVTVPFTFFYDCLNNLVEYEWENVTMVFTAYPLNIELSYLVYIPPKSVNLTSACDWQPLVMVFSGSLPKYYVQIKFSNAPENLKVTFFNVTLLNSFGITVQNTKIPSSVKSDMISVEFLTVEAGHYAISISVISAKASCREYKTNFFYVGEKVKDYSLIVFIILLILMFIFGSALLYFSCRWYIRRAAPLSKPTLLFVYSYKRIHHEFLVMYSKYLEIHYGVKVNMIYERTGNPKAWLEEKYLQSDVIVFIVSPGLKTLDQSSSHEEEHHWVDQLTEAKALIDNSYIGRKKVCKISFLYSGIHHMPKCLEHQGPFFQMFVDFDKFLCFIFDCPYYLHTLSKLFCEKHHKILMPNKKVEMDKEINKRLKMIMSVNLPCNEVKNINQGNLQFEHELHWNSEKNKSYTSNEKSNFTTSDDLLRSVDESPKLHQQESDSEDSENDDFVRYCVRKILNSA